MPFDIAKTRREFVIPQDLQDGACGVLAVTLKIPGGGRAHKIRLASLRGANEQADAAGESGRALIKTAQEAEFKARAEAKVNKAQGEEDEKSDPVQDALNNYHPRAVCEYCIAALDGERVGHDQILEYLESAAMPVIRWMAVEALRWGGLIEETKAEEGNDSGGSSAT